MPWVPRAVYELMVDALRRQAAAAPTMVPEAPAAAPMGAPVVAPVPSGPTPTDVVMPEVVATACIHYAFGDLEEQSANFQRAQALLRAGKTPADIVREIRQGARVEGLFV